MDPFALAPSFFIHFQIPLMNHPFLISSLAEVPLLDMQGPSFLVFYLAALIVASIWSVQRRSTAFGKFDAPRASDPQVTDPYEIAFLAGGVPRCGQLAVVRLMEAGAIERNRRTFSGSHLVAVGNASPEANEIERKLLASISGYGGKGMPLSNVASSTAARLHGIEARLAKLGLRPTQNERAGLGFKITLPLIFLLLIGLMKLMVGISRGKPVVFLMILLFVTLIVAVMVGSNAKRLTPAGESLLERMRTSHPSASLDGMPDLQMMSLGIALLGASAIGSYSHAMGIDATLQKDLSRMGATDSSSGGGGCSSGCGGGSGDGGGSSGCGGGGCGGCGGGD